MHFTSADLARNVLEAAPDAMVIIDELGIVRFANRQVTTLFGYPREEIVGSSIEQLVPERFRDRHRGHRKQYLSNVRVRPMGPGLALYGRRRDGSEFPVEIGLSPTHEGEQTVVIASIRDVSDRMRAQAELTLAREAAEHAREAADRANLAKSRFLATASHDLRQPLQTVALLNGALRRKALDLDMVQALIQQEQAIGTMSRLLNALLDISKLESGAIKPQPADFAVAAVFAELESEFSGAAVAKGIGLEVERPEYYVHSDASLVEQVLRNLLSNAIKYTHRGGVSLRCSLAHESIVRIDVNDTGIGIPPGQIAHIYDEFFQADIPANSSRDGYGLGLSIVQRIVKLLDLKIDVHSEVNRGTSFSLMLPAADCQLPPAVFSTKAAAPAPARRSGELRILLVEDNPGVREATRRLLEIEGYHVTAVASFSAALAHASDGHGIDILVTDYHLKARETGIEVLAALRNTLGVPLKAVLVTGDTSSAIRSLPRDPNLRIASKPLNADEFLKLLEELHSQS